MTSSALLVLGFMTLLWVVSVAKRNASIVDPWWSMLFLLISVNTAAQTGWTPGKTALVAVVALWAIRLWLHLTLRARGEPEDPRYQAFRQHYGPGRYWWVSYFQVFILQGVLAMLVAAPLHIACAADPPDTLSVYDWVGAAIAVFGIGFEAIADFQLQLFRNNPRNHGSVMDSGLFRYSRHPNYFGETVLWWGFFIMTVDTPGALLGLFGPLLMTFLLLRVSGVVMMDKHMVRTKPKYADYIRRTSSFVPMPPRAG